MTVVRVTLIKIEVAVFAVLRMYCSQGEGSGVFCMDAPDGTTIDQLLDMLGIPDTEMKQTYVNSLRREGDYVLKDWEKVAVFPPIAGG